MTFEYWYLFPLSVLIATTAMASGIGGAVFFSPLFILVLKLEPSIAIGTALAVATTRVLTGLLFDVSPTDARTFALTAMAFILASWLGSYVPARRATRVDPVVALKAE